MSSSLTTSKLIHLLSAKLIPLTPAAVRPITLTLSSLNLTIRPESDAIIIISDPDVGLTANNSSSSLRVIAILPEFLIFSNSLIGVRFTIPFLVANAR